MPKIVNRAERREEVCAAALRLIARNGASALTLRNLARELDGSITLVTHFFEDRDDLLEYIVDDADAYYRELFATIERPEDPVEDLRTVLRWIFPETPEEDEREAVRVALIPLGDTVKGLRHFFDSMEANARRVLADPVARLAEPDQIPPIVDALRASMNGVILSVLEHPDYWTAERRLSVVEFLVNGAVASAQKPGSLLIAR